LASYLVLFELFLVILTLLFVRSTVWQGLILNKALKTQKNAEDESCQIAHGNLRSEVITLRDEALAKENILLSLVERLKSSEAKLSSQAEA
jgi:cell division protein YceG involved in septum cleavage